jgi:hypothetical protein
MSFRQAYGNDWSENSWRMCNRDECALPISPDMTFVDTAPIRKGEPLTILSAWLKYYDDNIDPVSSPVWGWSADNDVETSNHLSGTALDINAPKYPWGSRVMPRDRIAKVRKGLDLFEGTIFWGADWDRADEMHFQMNFEEGDKRNDAFAAKLNGGYLGIYGGGGNKTGATSVWNEQIKNFLGNMVSYGTIMFHLDRKLEDVRHQTVDGWPQLGKNEKGPLTLIDNQAAQNAKLDAISAKLDELLALQKQQLNPKSV